MFRLYRTEPETRFDGLSLIESVYERGALLKHHAHSDCYISLVLAGKYLEVGAMVPRIWGAGAVVFHRRSEEHADLFHDEGKLLNVEFEDVHSIEEALNCIRRIKPKGQPCPKVWNGMRRIVQVLGKREERKPHWLGEVVTRFPWLDSASKIGAAADLAALSPTHFSRAFTRHLGCSPIEFRRKERVAAGVQALLGGDQPLRSIAQSAGFADQSHFTRSFQIETGMSPARFRRTFTR